MHAFARAALAAAAAAAALFAVAPAATAAEAVDLSKAETITLTAAHAGAFDGKTDTLKAVLLGRYTNAAAQDGRLAGVTVATEPAVKSAVARAARAAGAAKVDDANPLAALLAVAGDDRDTVPAWSSRLRAAAETLNTDKDVAGRPGAVGKADGTTLTFEGLTPGYYLIRDTTPAGRTGAIPMLVGTRAGGLSFDPASPLGAVAYKSLADNPDQGDLKPPTKGVDGDKTGAAGHSVGDTVRYVIRQTVPNTTGYTGYRLELRDVMGAGLDLTGDPKVTVDGETLDAGLYEYRRDGRTLTWSFGAVNDAVSPAVRDILKGDAAATFKPGAGIRIEYTAVVNSDAVRPGAAQNTIELDYSNNPNAWDKALGTLPGGSPDDTSRPVEVLLGSATLHATGADGRTGVGGIVVQIARPGSDEPLKWIRNPDGSYTLADKDDRDTVTELTSKADGDIILHGVNGQLQVTQKGGTGADFRVTVNAGRDPATGQTVTTVTLDTGHNRNNLARQTDAETVSWTAVAGGPAGHDGGGLANTGVTWAAAGAGAAVLLAAAGAALAVTRRRAGR